MGEKTKKLSNSRFYHITKSKITWIYDSYTNSIYAIKNSYFNALFNSELEKKLTASEKVEFNTIRNNIVSLKDIIPESNKSNSSTNVMINVSNNCNLNCSYCYRNKNDKSIASVEQIKSAIDYIMNQYEPNSQNYNFTFSMSSESSMDLKILKNVALFFDNYENWTFTQEDFINKNFEEVYQKLSSLKITEIEFPNYSKENTVLILNELIKRKDLRTILKLDENNLPDFIKTEIIKIDHLDYWKLHRVNRWLLECFFSSTFRSANVKYCSFNFFTNGTNASNEYINFVKNLDKESLMISIDGKKSVHDKNRINYQNQGSFDQIKMNLTVFRNHGLKLKASTTLTRKYPYPHKIIDQIKELGFEDVNLCIVREGSDSSFHQKDLPILFKSYRKVYKKLYKSLIQNDFAYYNFLKHDSCLTPFLSILNGTKIIKRCNLDTQLVIDTNGDAYDCLYFCSNKINKVGNISFSISKNNFNYDLLKVTNRQKCKDCWARYLCGGTCFYNSKCTTNSIYEPSPIECQIKQFYAIESIELLIKLKMKHFDFKKIL